MYTRNRRCWQSRSTLLPLLGKVFGSISLCLQRTLLELCVQLRQHWIALMHLPQLFFGATHETFRHKKNFYPALNPRILYLASALGGFSFAVMSLFREELRFIYREKLEKVQNVLFFGEILGCLHTCKYNDDRCQVASPSALSPTLSSPSHRARRQPLHDTINSKILINSELDYSFCYFCTQQQRWKFNPFYCCLSTDPWFIFLFDQRSLVFSVIGVEEKWGRH